ncbi:uncharacterized protein LOC143362467 [Halictus rubicundus]|uniref:uncharacterized protein LOC143362467 n=1 Tax=Halictus rubicundus TaxID=77578 RepID=UPI0040358261
MDDLEDLLVEQRLAIGTLSRVMTNYKKIGKAKQNVAIATGRLRLLQEKWNLCTKLHTRLHQIASEELQAKESYFTAAEFSVAEELYYEAYVYFNGQIAGFKVTHDPSETSAPSDESPKTAVAPAAIKTPRIDLPKFSGQFKDCLSFKDLYESLIHSNAALTHVQRLHYLKSTLEGEASQLLQHVTGAAANSESAWKLLVERYDNKRILIQTQLSALFDLSPVTNDNFQALKSLRDVTHQVLSVLKNLGCSTDKWDHLIVHLMSRKLDKLSLREWEMTQGESTAYPTYASLDKFLVARIRSLEIIQLAPNLNSRASPHSSTGNKTVKTSVHAHSTSSAAETVCPCGSRHRINTCFKKRLNVAQRKELLRSQRRCFNCLRIGHLPTTCPSVHSCQKCDQRHHTLLHQHLDAARDSGQDSATASTADIAATSTPASPATELEVKSASSVNINCLREHALTKQHVFFATAIVTVEASNGRRLRVRALLDQGAEATFVSCELAQALRTKRHSTATRVSGVGESSYRARVPLNPSGCPHLKDLTLADLNPSGSEPISLIIGADYYGSLLREGLRQGPPGAPTAQLTLFGWVLSGSLCDKHSNSRTPPNVTLSHCLTAAEPSPLLQNLHKALTRFWEVEELTASFPLSEEDQKCEEHFVRTHSRASDGRYVVRLPFKEEPPVEVGESLSRARVLMSKVSRRLDRNAELREQYTDFMSEYIQLGHMYNAPASSAITFPVYLPHHPVIKESSSTTKPRVVFNASSPTSNTTTLNDHLLTGPKLQADISSIVTAWRIHPYVYKADLQKMFRQIRVSMEDQDYQRILWCSSPQTEPTHYRLATVTYGTACAPLLANRVLLQLAEDEGAKFPRAQRIVRRNFYVDDAFFGAFSASTAKEIRDELIALMQKGGFTLHKWASNCATLFQGDRSANEAHPIVNDPSNADQQKVLGISWHPVQDVFRFSFSSHPPRAPTKRNVLSLIARLYDPLGWITPTVIQAKILMQDLWLSGIDWDDALPEELAAQWSSFTTSLPDVQHLLVPRWLGIRDHGEECELHGFADASTRAYAAVVYLRLTGRVGPVKVIILATKSKVSPVKTLSVPRLELSAAVLLSRLMKRVIVDLDLQSAPVHAWSDSTVTLAWLSKHPATWQTFVANRVAEVHSNLPNAKWHYVMSQDNPADCASRGLTPTELRDHSLWWNGPAWLQSPSAVWPITPIQDSSVPLPERRLHFVQAELADPPPPPLAKLPDIVSSWSKLLRITGIIFRFRDRLQRRGTTRSYCDIAKEFWAKCLQTAFYAAELKALRKGVPIPRASPLRRLNPILHEHGIIRVGRRLRHAPLSDTARHPMVLPQHRVFELVCRHCHARCLHAGTQLTLEMLRREFWMISARKLVKTAVRQCVTCVRQRAATPQQLMGDLPPERVSPTRSFTNTGVDYAGPYLVRTTKGRGHKAHKAYLALFICLSSRAIHLELVRPGKSTEFREDTSIDSISWRFIPPGAPHFGGIWEAGVKSVKGHLKRVLGDQTLTYEEFSTLLCQIEACLNSRPLAPISDDPDDLDYLTPGHFLVGCPLLALPERSAHDAQPNLLTRWKRVQHMLEHFWRRWRDEYLHHLQQRGKWNKRVPNFRSGSLVILRQPNLPPTKWKLARVVECHPGQDASYYAAGPVASRSYRQCLSAHALQSSTILLAVALLLLVVRLQRRPSLEEPWGTRQAVCSEFCTNSGKETDDGSPKHYMRYLIETPSWYLSRYL